MRYCTVFKLKQIRYNYEYVERLCEFDYNEVLLDLIDL